MMKTMLLLLATLAAAYAAGVPAIAPIAPVAYDYGTTIHDGSFQQSRVTGYAGLGYGLGHYGYLGYRGLRPYYSILDRHYGGHYGGYYGGLYDGYYGGLGYGRYLPGHGLGGH